VQAGEGPIQTLIPHALCLSRAATNASFPQCPIARKISLKTENSIYFGNHTQTLFYSLIVIVFLAVIFT